MGDMSDLTERQRRMLEMIREFMAEYGYPPTVREIGADVGISSTSVVSHNVKTLQKKGYLRRDPNVSRGLQLVQDDPVVSIPLLGVIAAGQPIPVPDDDFPDTELDYYAIPTELIKNADNVFALRVRGDSMIDAMIADGDVVIVRNQQSAENGDTIVAWLKEEKETTLKSFYLEEGKRRVRLQPRNPLLEPIYCDPDNLEVQGKVIGVIRSLA